MTRSHFIEILTILTKYLFDLGVRLTEFSITVESETLRLYCTDNKNCFGQPSPVMIIQSCYDNPLPIQAWTSCS